jgi:choline dehydrogenase-like flavoprotein
MPQDFKHALHLRRAAGSSLEDWPISYDDLEPFYEKAEYEIGISGDYSGTPFHGPRKRRSAHAAAAAQSRVLNPGAGGKAPWPASVSHSHGPQQRALQRPRPLHALPLVRADLSAKRTPRTARRTP